MKIFIQTDYSLWKVILEGPNLPTKTVDGEIVPKDEKMNGLLVILLI